MTAKIQLFFNSLQICRKWEILVWLITRRCQRCLIKAVEQLFVRQAGWTKTGLRFAIRVAELMRGIAPLAWTQLRLALGSHRARVCFNWVCIRWCCGNVAKLLNECRFAQVVDGLTRVSLCRRQTNRCRRVLLDESLDWSFWADETVSIQRFGMLHLCQERRASHWQLITRVMYVG